jgi:FkbM family methyltransferase
MSILSKVGRHLPQSLQPMVRKYRNEWLVRNCAPEPDAVACKRYIAPGANVLDIGANIGSFTRVFSEYVGASGTVHAVEPVRETFGYLLNNVEKLGLKNVFVYNAAASDRCGFSRITIPSWEGGGRNFYEASVSDSGEFPARLLTLDLLFYDLKPSFIKCDVEDHDVQVVLGAQRIIKDFAPAWLLEVAHPETVMPLMQSYGYRPLNGENSVFFLPPQVACGDVQRA